MWKHTETFIFFAVSRDQAPSKSLNRAGSGTVQDGQVLELRHWPIHKQIGVD